MQENTLTSSEKIKFEDVVVQYLQDYIALCERALDAGQDVLMNRRRYDDNDNVTEETPKAYALLEKLNQRAREDGVSPQLIRTEFLDASRLRCDGEWYTSTVECEIANGDQPEI